MKWYLQSSDDLHTSLELTPNEVVSLGRSTETGITDKDVSKIHTLFKFQPAKNIVLCKHIGKHPAIVNGEIIKKDMKVRIGMSSVVELISGKYRYSIVSQGEKRHIATTVDSPPPKRQQTTSPPSSTPSRVSAALTTYLADNLSLVDPSPSPGSPWSVTKDLIVRKYPEKGRQKIAAFDLDHTIITTISGNVFPKDLNDWDIMWPRKVLPKLKQYHLEGYKILILSNQNGIEKKKISVDQFKEKCEKVVRRLDIPVQVMAAPRSSATRKPAPGMWVGFEKFYNDNVIIDYRESLYVGDAAGRAAGWDPDKKKRKDFSSSDREFAENVGIKFYTPEAFFLGHKETDDWSYKSFNPRNYKQLNLPLTENNQKIASDTQEVVILVGYPGSGKSHFSKRYLNSYVRVNMDELKSIGKCLAVLGSTLSEGKSVVIDNTSPTVVSRKRYIEVAEQNNVAVRCFVMTTTIEHSKHNNRFRRLAGAGDQVPGIAFNTFKAKYQEPTLGEGLAGVVRVNFLPLFESEDLCFEELYFMFQGG